jgi:hypothetical protein
MFSYKTSLPSRFPCVFSEPIPTALNGVPHLNQPKNKSIYVNEYSTIHSQTPMPNPAELYTLCKPKLHFAQPAPVFTSKSMHIHSYSSSVAQKALGSADPHIRQHLACLLLRRQEKALSRSGRRYWVGQCCLDRSVEHHSGPGFFEHNMVGQPQRLSEPAVPQSSELWGMLVDSG